MRSKKITVLIIIVISLVLLLGGTFAWYIWSTSNDEEVQVLAGLDAARIVYNGGSDITNASLKPVATKEDGIVKKVKVYALDNVNFSLSFNLYLDVIELGEGLKDASFKYAIYKNNTTLVKEGNFSIDYLNNNLVSCTTNSTSHIVLLSNEEITEISSVYTLYIWIDGNMSNPNTMQNQTFNFKLHADGQNAVLGTPPTAAEYITNLYTKAEKTPVVNNNITYQYDTTHNLMSDIADNVRYYGTSPNNYIYFNCSDYSNQSLDTCEKWRIIGVFGDKVKIIRNESIGTYSWDTSASSKNGGNGINEWSQADLMKLLNPGYESETVGGSLYWNSGNGTCYSDTNNFKKSCDFTNTGLKNDTTRNMIAEVTWNLGGDDNFYIYSNRIYSYERGTKVISNPSDGVTRTTSWPGKIALAYPSDYGYAADFNSCTQTLGDYNDSTCTSANWMKTMIDRNDMWLLTPHSSDADYAWNVSFSGGMNFNSASYAYEVRPVLYLNSKAIIEPGEGTSSLPYRLSVS